MGRQLKIGVVENGDFSFIHSLSSEHFTYMATRQLSCDATVGDLGRYFKVFRLFHIKFLKKMVRDTAKVTIDH